MKHEHLVAHALRYLKRCCVFSTTQGLAFERPDAMGWMASGQSIVLEAKTSRKDLLGEWSRQDRKTFRHSGGLGVLRSYITPPGIVTAEEVESWGWGLIEVQSNRCVRIAESDIWLPNLEYEIRLMATILSKVKIVFQEPQLKIEFTSEEQKRNRKQARSTLRRQG